MTSLHPESQDLSDGPIGLVTLALALLIGSCFAAAFLAQWALDAPPERGPAAIGSWQPGDTPQPADPVEVDREALEAAWDAQSVAWAWIDRERGVARIPVARAAALRLAAGFPAREESHHDE